MSGMLAAAKQREVTGEKKKKPEPTVWKLARRHPLGRSIDEVVRLNDLVKDCNKQLAEHKAALKEFGDERLIKSCVADRALPSSPMFIQNADGVALNYVTNDCCGSSGLASGEVDELETLLGVDKVRGMICEQTEYSLDDGVMKLPGVAEVVDRHLTAARNELVNTGVLKADQGERLVKASTFTGLKRGTLDRLPEIAGRSKSRLKIFLSIIGATFKRYIKT